jgi:hypothetical protein
VPLDIIHKRRHGTIDSEKDSEVEIVYEKEPSSGTTAEDSDTTVKVGSSKGREKPKPNRYIIDTIAGQRIVDLVNPESAGMTLLSRAPRSFQSPSFRYNWEMLVSVEPTAFHWTYQVPDKLQERDNSRHSGSFTINEESTNLDLVLSNGIAKFLSIYTEYDEAVDEIELPVRISLGRIFADLMSTEHLRASW